MWKAKLRYNIVYTWMKEPEEDLSKQGDTVYSWIGRLHTTQIRILPKTGP